MKATVPMRRNPNSQNMQSKITDAIATPQSKAASPRRPTAVVEAIPIKGVVKLATIAGPAMANTRAVVTLVRKWVGVSFTGSSAYWSGVIIFGSCVPLFAVIH